MKPMNIIFLDIDGVLNSDVFYKKRHSRRWYKFITYWYWILSRTKYVINGFKYKPVSLVGYKTPEKHLQYPYLLKRLKEETDSLCWNYLIDLVKQTECKICISSCWKHHFKNSTEWSQAFTNLGFPPGTFWGITPNTRSPNEDSDDFTIRAERGFQIQAWLDKNGDLVNKYAIIDDDRDMLPQQLPNFFQTDAHIGLTPEICNKIKFHFNSI